MYDKGHRFFGLSNIETRRVEIFHKGLREPLLCKDCEQQFGRYENYARGIFYGGTRKGVSRIKNSILISELDYKRLKLFFMSILWRFGITSLEYYKGATLGPHEENLRKILYVEDPCDYRTYPCLVTAVVVEGKHLSDLIVPPALARIDQHWIWSLVVGGFLLTFYVSSHLPPSLFYPAFLKPDGTMIIQIKEITEIDFLYKQCCKIGKKHDPEKFLPSVTNQISPSRSRKKSWSEQNCHQRDDLGGEQSAADQ